MKISTFFPFLYILFKKLTRKKLNWKYFETVFLNKSFSFQQLRLKKKDHACGVWLGKVAPTVPWRNATDCEMLLIQECRSASPVEQPFKAVWPEKPRPDLPTPPVKTSNRYTPLGDPRLKMAKCDEGEELQKAPLKARRPHRLSLSLKWLPTT